MGGLLQVLMQAEDRVHRIGQQDSVTIQYLIARNTADDYIWPLIQHKLSVLGKAGLSKDNFGDTDMHVLKESRQNDLLKYFKESFIEEEIVDGDSEVSNAMSETRPSSRSESAGADILKYVRHESGPAAAAPSQTSDASVEWMNEDDDDELLSSEHLDSADSDVSWPKKPKIR